MCNYDWKSFIVVAIFVEPPVHLRIHRVGFKTPFASRLPALTPVKISNSLFERSHRKNVKFARGDRFDHVVAQH